MRYYAMYVLPHEGKVVVYFDVEQANEESTSQDGLNKVEYITSYEGNIPYVVATEFTDKRKVSLIIDWIEDAIITALPPQYQDNHVNGFMNYHDEHKEPNYIEKTIREIAKLSEEEGKEKVDELLRYLSVDQ